MKKLKQLKEMMQRALQNQKGLTLIELLAVIVILAVISAIAIPSIGNIIDNSKKDAYLANGQQLVNAARMAVAAGDDPGTDNQFTLTELIEKGYIETFIDPDTKKAHTATGTPSSNSTYVQINKTNGQISHEVFIDGEKRTLGPIDPSTAKRSDVTDK